MDVNINRLSSTYLLPEDNEVSAFINRQLDKEVDEQLDLLSEVAVNKAMNQDKLLSWINARSSVKQLEAKLKEDGLSDEVKTALKRALSIAQEVLYKTEEELARSQKSVKEITDSAASVAQKTRDKIAKETLTWIIGQFLRVAKKYITDPEKQNTFESEIRDACVMQQDHDALVVTAQYSEMLNSVPTVDATDDTELE